IDIDARLAVGDGAAGRLALGHERPSRGNLHLHPRPPSHARCSWRTTAGEAPTFAPCVPDYAGIAEEAQSEQTSPICGRRGLGVRPLRQGRSGVGEAMTIIKTGSHRGHARQLSGPMLAALLLCAAAPASQAASTDAVFTVGNYPVEARAENAVTAK